MRIRPAALLAFGAVLAVAWAATPVSEAAETWLTGRALDEDGSTTAASSDIFLGSGASQQTTSSDDAFFVLDELVPGSRDLLCVTGFGSRTGCGRQTYVSLEPRTGVRLDTLDLTDLLAWRSSVSMDTDGTVGEVFGVVRDAAGAPVAGATVTLEPPSGTLFYFGAGGLPDPSATSTDATGRYLFLDTIDGPFRARAEAAATTIGLGYGEAFKDAVAFVDLAPPVTVSGTVVDEVGSPLAGAAVSWDFDGSIATTTAAGGSWSLTELAEGLDLTVVSSAAGFRDASTFRRSAAETANPAAIEIRMMSDATFMTLPGAFGVVHAPALGMIRGRVVDSTGVPVAGAVVTTDPAVGNVRYFDAGGSPAPSAAATSSSGEFIIFNVPLGDVVVAALAPAHTIRSAVSPSLSGGVTQGDLVAYEAQVLSGFVLDEEFRAFAIGGAIVQVVEFPQLVTIANADGSYSISGVPRDTLVSLRAAKVGFVDSYTLRRDSGSSPTRTQDLFLPTESAVLNLYRSRGVAFSRGLASATVDVELSNCDATGFFCDGVIGLEGRMLPETGFSFYPDPNRRRNRSSTTILGNINILSIVPANGAVEVSDPRNDFAELVPVPLRANGVIVDDFAIPCDPSPVGLFPLYPCDGTVMDFRAGRVTFHWNGRDSDGTPDDDMDGTGDSGLSFQVQFSTDPAFATIDITSKTSDKKFVKNERWRPGKSRWKKILRLGDGGATVYWRVLQRERSPGIPIVETLSPVYSFTVAPDQASP